jgi:hypothetical protein
LLTSPTSTRFWKPSNPWPRPSPKGVTNCATVILDKEEVVRYVKVYDIPQQRANHELIAELNKLS